MEGHAPAEVNLRKNISPILGVEGVFDTADISALVMAADAF